MVTMPPPYIRKQIKSTKKKKEKENISKEKWKYKLKSFTKEL